jgi:protein-S-isoprenylcysteine O-methyltransferase Ste14
MSVRWFVAGYAGLAGFLGLEALLRERGDPSRLDPSADDQDTTRLIVTAYFVAALAAPVVRRAPGSRFPRAAGPAGLVVEAAGLGLRAWSMRTLGRSYSRTLRPTEEHVIVDGGPYRIIRHPGYLGSILTWTGFAFTSRSLPVVAVVATLLGHAYQRRIEAEEALLLREHPAYAAYRSRTWKVVPLVW